RSFTKGRVINFAVFIIDTILAAGPAPTVRRRLGRRTPRVRERGRRFEAGGYVCAAWSELPHSLSMPSVASLIERTYRPELLLILREWVETRRPEGSERLLETIDRRLHELARDN